MLKWIFKVYSFFVIIIKVNTCMCIKTKVFFKEFFFLIFKVGKEL
jgi:hypothetical protein